MRTVAVDVEHWIAEGATAIALATTARTWGSAPLPAGSAMAVAPDGRFSGSVSGGCVEAAVIEAAADVLAGGAPRMLTFTVGDETAWSVGLACGGELAVWLERWSAPAWRLLSAQLDAPTRAKLIRLTDGPTGAAGRRYVDAPAAVVVGAAAESAPSARPIRRLADPRGDVPAVEPDAIDAAVAARLAADPDGVTEAGTSDHWSLAEGAEVSMLTVSLTVPPPVIIVGAGAIAVALSQIAALVDAPVVVVDPRRTFVTADRFADARTLLHAWPADAFRRHPIPDGAAVVVLSHDPRIDDPALHAALHSAAGYIGALGGRASQARRRERLLADGFSARDVARVRGPVGLPIGARSPQEIALSIMAEIVAARRAAT